MQRPIKSKLAAEIENAYYRKLEYDAVDFIESEDIGNRQTEFNIKDEYIETVENMIDYVWGMDTWIGKWTLDLYNTAKENN